MENVKKSRVNREMENVKKKIILSCLCWKKDFPIRFDFELLIVSLSSNSIQDLIRGLIVNQLKLVRFTGRTVPSTS